MGGTVMASFFRNVKYHMITGFGPFEYPTCGLLQRGQDHSPPKACYI